MLLVSAKRIDLLEKRLDEMENMLLSAKEPSCISKQDGSSMAVSASYTSDQSIETETSIEAHSWRLPPRSQVLSLLHEFFEQFNCVFPLFDQTSLVQTVGEHYDTEGEQIKSKGLWSAINVCLALAQRFRAMRYPHEGKEDQLSWAYLGNAMGVATDLLLQNEGLLGLQTLLGIAIFLQGTPEPHPMTVVVAASIELLHKLGLHREDPNSGLSASQSEQRRRVFWIAYIFDKDLSLRLNRPPLQHDDDFDVELPHESALDGQGKIATLDGTAWVNYFCLRVQLAIIQNSIFKEVYSVRASKQTEEQRNAVRARLTGKLERWGKSMPPEFRPRNLTKFLPQSSVLHMVILYLSYFNSLTVLHGHAIINQSWAENVLSSMERSIEETTSLRTTSLLPCRCPCCVDSARTSIYLINLLPFGDFAYTW